MDTDSELNIKIFNWKLIKILVKNWILIHFVNVLSKHILDIHCVLQLAYFLDIKENIFESQKYFLFEYKINVM